MKPEEILKQYYGYDSFRSGQKEIIDAILNKQDVMAIMPTGAGKSVCFQIPAMMLPGITLVFSPLRALIQDQVQALNENGIPAAYITSDLSVNGKLEVFEKVKAGDCKLLYVAPERLKNREFLDFIKEIEISMVTVDEAHCISQWGQNFRPDYMKIVDFVASLPVRPVVSAFTATATKEVKEDILCTLGLIDPFVFVLGYDRPNLTFKVENGDKDQFLIDYVKDHSDDSGIIYCATRKNTDAVYDKLLAAGVNAVKYHAGLAPRLNRESLEAFVHDRVPVMVATTAFGMGIDKSNVRYVIHYNMPQCIENYYQEAGRAGRDGEAAECILLYSADAVAVNINIIEHSTITDVDEETAEVLHQRDMKRLYRMDAYCRTAGCLRNDILKYFGEQPTGTCQRCSNCKAPVTEKDVTKEARAIIACIKEERKKRGVVKVINILVGAKTAEMREIGAESMASYGSLTGTSKDLLKTIIYSMIDAGYLSRTEDDRPVVLLGAKADELMDETATFTIKVNEAAETKKKTQLPAKKESFFDDLTSFGRKLFDLLREKRLDLAREANIPPYMVFADSVLLDMCRKVPQTKDEILAIKGISTVKYEKYGEIFAGVIGKFVAEHPDKVISTYVEEAEPEKSEKPKTPAKPYSRHTALFTGMTACECNLFEELRVKRAEISREQSVPSYVVFPDTVLVDMCRNLPQTREEMLAISGISDIKYEKYGSIFAEVIQKCLEANPNWVKSSDTDPDAKTDSSQEVFELAHEKEKARKRLSRFYEEFGNPSEGLKELLKKVEMYRIERCVEEQKPVEDIIFRRTIIDIVNKLPRTEEEFRYIAGMNEEKIRKYGQKLLEFVEYFISNYPEEINKTDTVSAVEQDGEQPEESIGTSSERPDADKCKGLTFAVTGKVFIFASRKEITNYIKEQGGIVSGSVSAKTDYLINNDNLSGSTKNRSAKALGVPIITEEEFVKMFGSIQL